jgi:peptidoglycan/LPS O-acetylase OafA/YrhL
MSAQRWLIALASVLGFWHNLLMQQDGWGYFHYCLNVYWSLSVEEAFYLLFPLLCRLLRRDGLIALAAGLLLLIGPVYRATHAADEIDYLYAYPACFDAIAAGVLCSLASRRWVVPTSWAAALLPEQRLLLLLVYLLLSAGLAWALARGVGNPAMRAWRRWARRQTEPAAM